MKKYDIALLGLYIVAIALCYSFSQYVYRHEQEAKRLFKSTLDNQAITKIVIEDVESNMEVFYAKEHDDDMWRLRGNLNQTHLDNIYIEEGVLHIENIEKRKLRMLKINRNIPIEIRNSPRVKILSDEELAKTLSNERVGHAYEF